MKEKIQDFIKTTENLTYEDAQSHIKALNEFLDTSSLMDIISLKEIPAGEAISLFEQLVKHFDGKIKSSNIPSLGKSSANVTDSEENYRESINWEDAFSSIRQKIATRLSSAAQLKDFLFFYEKSSSISPHLIVQELAVDSNGKTALLHHILESINPDTGIDALQKIFLDLWSAVIFPSEESTPSREGEIGQLAQNFLTMLSPLISLYLYRQSESFRQVFEKKPNLRESSTANLSYFARHVTTVSEADLRFFTDTPSKQTKEAFYRLFNTTECSDLAVFPDEIKDILFQKIIDTIYPQSLRRKSHRLDSGRMRQALCHLLLLDTEYFMTWWPNKGKYLLDQIKEKIVSNDTSSDWVLNEFSKHQFIDIIGKNPRNIGVDQQIRSFDQVMKNRERIWPTVYNGFLEIIGDHFNKLLDIDQGIKDFSVYASFSKQWRAQLEGAKPDSNYKDPIIIFETFMEELFRQYHSNSSDSMVLGKITMPKLVQYIGGFYNELSGTEQHKTLNLVVFKLKANDILKSDAGNMRALLLKMLNIHTQDVDEVFQTFEGRILLLKVLKDKNLKDNKGNNAFDLSRYLIESILKDIEDTLQRNDFEGLAAVFDIVVFKQLLPSLRKCTFFDALCRYISLNKPELVSTCIEYLSKKIVSEEAWQINKEAINTLLLFHQRDAVNFYQSLQSLNRCLSENTRINVLMRCIHAYFEQNNPTKTTNNHAKKVEATSEKFSCYVNFIKSVYNNITQPHYCIEKENLDNILKTFAEHVAQFMDYKNIDDIALLVQEIPWILEVPMVKESMKKDPLEQGRKKAESIAHQYSKNFFSTAGGNVDILIQKVLKPIYQYAEYDETKQSVLLAILQGLKSAKNSTQPHAPVELCWFLALGLHQLDFNTQRNNQKLSKLEAELLKEFQNLRSDENFDKCAATILVEYKTEQPERQSWLAYIVSQPRQPRVLVINPGTGKPISEESSLWKNIQKEKQRRSEVENQPSAPHTVVETTPFKESSLDESIPIANMMPLSSKGNPTSALNIDTPMPTPEELDRTHKEIVGHSKNKKSWARNVLKRITSSITQPVSDSTVVEAIPIEEKEEYDDTTGIFFDTVEIPVATVLLTSTDYEEPVAMETQKTDLGLGNNTTNYQEVTPNNVNMSKHDDLIVQKKSASSPTARDIAQFSFLGRNEMKLEETVVSNKPLSKSKNYQFGASIFELPSTRRPDLGRQHNATLANNKPT